MLALDVTAMAVLWAWGLSILLSFKPSFLMVPGNGPSSEGKTIGTSEKQQSESWRGLMSLSLFQVGQWKQCALEAAFWSLLKPRSLRDASFPSLLCAPVLPAVRHYIYKPVQEKDLVSLRLQGVSFVSAGSEFCLSQRHFHSAPVAQNLSKEENLSPRTSDPFSMYHYPNCGQHTLFATREKNLWIGHPMCWKGGEIYNIYLSNPFYVFGSDNTRHYLH